MSPRQSSFTKGCAASPLRSSISPSNYKKARARLSMRASWGDYFKVQTMAGRHDYHFPPCGAWARSAQRPCIRKPVLGPDGLPRNGRCPHTAGHSLKPAAPKSAAGTAAIKAGAKERGDPLPRLGRPPKKKNASTATPRPKPPMKPITLTAEENQNDGCEARSIKNLNIPARNKAYEIGARIMADSRIRAGSLRTLASVNL
jgi:hypothetical protein